MTASIFTFSKSAVRLPWRAAWWGQPRTRWWWWPLDSVHWRPAPLEETEIYSVTEDGLSVQKNEATNLWKSFSSVSLMWEYWYKVLYSTIQPSSSHMTQRFFMKQPSDCLGLTNVFLHPFYGNVHLGHFHVHLWLFWNEHWCTGHFLHHTITVSHISMYSTKFNYY